MKSKNSFYFLVPKYLVLFFSNLQFATEFNIINYSLLENLP